MQPHLHSTWPLVSALELQENVTYAHRAGEAKPDVIEMLCCQVRPITLERCLLALYAAIVCYILALCTYRTAAGICS